MIKLLNRTGLIAGLWLALTQTALAQNAEPLEYSDTSANPAAPRVLRYRVESTAPEREDSKRQPESATAAAAADAGLLSPFTLSPQIAAGRAWTRAVGGFDSATRAYRARASAESSLTRFLALRVDFEHGPSTTASDRVSLGTRLQFLNQKSHGLDLGMGVFYLPYDFRREGNVAAGVMVGRRIGRVFVFGSAVAGSDPEGDDQELDGRLATLVRVLHWLELGWDGRYRSVFTNDNKRRGTDTVDWELALLPNSVVTVGPVAMITEAGFYALHQTQAVGQPDQHKSLRTGLLAMAGAGLAF